ncbi:type II toxin-antitoxin system RelE/ParE family toxin [Corallococcus terminator]|uniref:Type II toxin-antitoxin system RelE/ParE family toxin n=1 Tax=Corallococcus terminator TaxID=2316733 RepID=A0A3A8J1J9_9BACT|nr:type II toxin-antitoxin system RelE/ParE family toxin [Corallococcus terminator]
MPIQLHPAATSEIEEVSDWYEDQRQGAGDLLDAAVLRALTDIEEHPDRWPLWPGIRHTPPIRRFLLQDHPFAIPYLIRDESVVVLAFAHLRRRPGYWLPRAHSSR